MIDPGHAPKYTPKSVVSIDKSMQPVIKYMSINDIASLLSISKRTFERVLEHDERFPKPCITISKKMKWKESKIIDFLDSNVGIHLKTS